MQTLKNLLDLVPGADAPAEQIYRYRLMCVVFAFGVTWALAVTWGHLPWVSRGLAHAEQVEVQIDKTQDKIEHAQQETRKAFTKLEGSIANLTELFVREKERSLRNEIFQARQAQCRATSTNGRAAAITSRLVELRAEYLKLTGNDYPVPTCSEVL